MGKHYKYMVEFKFSPFSFEMEELIPKQRLVVERLFEAGILFTYTLASDRSQLWVVLQADSESELMTYIDDFPLTRFSEYNYKEIMFHDTVRFIPSMSMN